MWYGLVSPREMLINAVLALISSRFERRDSQTLHFQALKALENAGRPMPGRETQ